MFTILTILNIISISYLLLNIENEPIKIGFKKLFLIACNITLIIIINI